MSRTNNVKLNMGYLGDNYQYLLVKYLIETPKFFTSICQILDQNMFTDEHLRRIVGIMKDRYSKIGVVPNYNDIDLIVNTTVSDQITAKIIVAKLHELMNRNFDIDVDLLTSNAEKFFKQQNLAKAINQCTEILKRGNADSYFNMEDLIKKALETNMNTNLGFHLFDNLEDDLKEDYRCAIPTGADKLDEALYGGLGKGELGLIISPLGVGKAQPLHAKILTPHGYKTMGDIQIGDYVIGGDGVKHKVINTFYQGIRPVYKISFSNGTSCECDIDHLWNVNTLSHRRNRKYANENKDEQSFKTISLREIIDKGWCRIDSKGQKKEYIFNIPNVKPVDFDYQKICIDPYFLGYYIGNKNFGKKQIYIPDKDYDEIRVFLTEKMNGQINEHFDSKRNMCGVVLNNELFAKVIEMFNDNQKDNNFIPKEYLYNTLDNRLNFFRGLMDSNGIIGNRGTCYYSTKNEKLANDVYFLARSFGGKASIKVKQSKYYSQKHNKYIECGIIYIVTMSFEDDVVPFKYSRNVEKYKHENRYNNQVKIFDVQYVRDEETKCILVDSEEHTYVTEDFIVTHNTSATTGFAANAATHKCDDNNFKGYKVLHFFFEDTEVSIRRKYFGYVTNIDACDLSDPTNRPIALKILKDNNNELRNALSQNVICQRLTTGEYSASDIRYLIKQYISRGFIPDLVIIDYFECLKPEKNTEGYNESEWSREGITMRKLEAIAKDFNVALWVPIQSTKDAIGQDYVGVGQAGGSVKKTQIGHLIIQFAQNPQQKEEGRMSIFIGKLRAVKVGRTSFSNIKFNNGTCKFDMSDMDSIDNELIGNQNGKITKKFEQTVKAIATSVK